MKKIKLTMAQALLRFLSNQFIEIDGVESRFVHGVFSIFGHGNVTGIGEALEYANHGIKTYRGNNEQGMAHAAIAFAKQKNRLAIMPCTSSIGPGALNMVTAAGVATSNPIPLLLLPGDIFADRQPDPVLQQIEQPHDYTISANDAFKPVSKYWDRITRPEMLMTACINTLRVLTDPAETGTVTLCLPQDVQAESYDYPEHFFAKRIWHIDRACASERALKEAAELIKAAKNQVIIAGGGVHYSLATETLNQFALLHQVASCETQAGKSALAWDHAMNLGGVGTTGTAAANQLIRQADVILAIGTRLQDFTTASKWLYPEAKIVQVNTNAADSVKMDAESLKGDAKAILQELSKHLHNYQTSKNYQQQVKELKADWDQEVDRLYSEQNSEQLSQLVALGVLNEFVSSEDTVICAAGSLPGDLHRVWRSRSPKDYHLEYAFSCMGYEVAAGLGVKLAKESEGCSGEAYVVVGDGSFLMLHSELVTAIQEGKKFTILLFDNSGFQCIHNLQTANGSAGFGTELKYRSEDGLHHGENLKINFSKYAEALGVKAYQASCRESLNQALAKAKEDIVPVLIEMKIAPKSMSAGYDAWWRVGVAEQSLSEDVKDAFIKIDQEMKNLRDY